MANNKYYYAIVNKENGKLLLDEGRLPIYYNKSVAKDTAKNFTDYVVHPILIEGFDYAIFRGGKIKS